MEAVEWQYYGLNGKIIPWTLEHGGTSHDPSVQAFVVARDGKVLSRCPNGKTYNASGFSSWLKEQVAGYARAYPRTAFTFETPDMDMIDGRPESESFIAARRGDKPVLLFVGRESAAPRDRRAAKEVKATRKMERTSLSSKKAAEAAAGKYVLFRIDLADERQAKWARARLGIEKAPRFLLFLRGQDKPVDLTKVSKSSLAYHLKKHAPK